MSQNLEEEATDVDEPPIEKDKLGIRLGSSSKQTISVHVGHAGMGIGKAQWELLSYEAQDQDFD